MEPKLVYFARNLNRETGKLREAVVWNRLKNCVLAEFDKQGLFETTDEETISVLTKLGYRKVTLDMIRERKKLTPSELVEAEKRRESLGYQTVQDPALLEDLRKDQASRKIRPEDFSDEDDMYDLGSLDTAPTRNRRSLVK